MNTLLHKMLTGICLLGLMTACDPDEPGGGGEGGAGAEGGQIGAGGEGGAGAQGGQGGEGGGVGGEGGGVGGEGGGNPDGPCNQLSEAQCNTRDDCVAQTDVFDDFSRCSDADTAACRFLDEAQCGGRDDCAWNAEDDQCGAPQLTCADHADPAACEGADCYWHGDSCHDEPPQAQCDQPDPASCEAADCQWTDDGCIPLCETFGEPACNARPECEWTPEGCAPAPEMMDCAELDPENCVARADCTWFDDACIDRPMGDCNGLAEMACIQRPDCEPLYNDGARPAPPPGEEDPELPPEPPEPGYQGCQERVFDCGEVPLEACDRTPGCQLMEEEDAIFCASIDPDGCANLDPDRCEEHPRCRPEFQVICDEDGVPEDDFFPEPEPCREEFRCLPDAPRQPCAETPVDQCWERRDCQVLEDPECFEGGGAPPPPDGERADPIQPPQCLVCADREPEPGECWDLNEGACNNRADCRWNAIDGPGIPVEPDDCACPPDEPDCGCGGAPAIPAPPPPNGGFCEPIPVQDCWDLNERACVDTDGCRWVNDGGGPVPPPEPVPCECPDGEPNCPCPDLIAPPPGGGFCEPDRPQGCGDFRDPANCNAVGCEWVGGGGGCECWVDEETGEEHCECWEEEGFCRDRRVQDDCAELAPDECEDVPFCEWVEGMEVPCECPPGEPCACPGVPGICRRIQAEDCGDLNPEMCEEVPGCRLEEIFPPCAEPCDPERDPDCEPMECEPILVCVNDEPVGPCGGAGDPMACEANGCEWIEEGAGGCDCWIDEETGEEVCACDGGGGGFCQPPRPPADRCMGFGPEECADAPHCWAIDCDIACQGQPECEAECPEFEGQCVDGAQVCPQAPIELCDQIDACRVVVEEICGGGCDMEGNCDEPVCREERRCVANEGGGEVPDLPPMP